MPLSRIKEIFSGALDLPFEQRSIYIRQECGADSLAVSRIMRMVRAHEEEWNFLESPPLVSASTVTAELETPATIGPYRILQAIGEGGMGVVYLAEQSSPIKRRVAIKLIKLGMDTKSVVARFEAERQALAMLSHRSVARVYEAGATEKGRPYFVMEYVAGEPITKFCDAHNLTLQKRLGLFTQVCAAIQHAHQKGIIHRDIKPSNVLVTREEGEAVPKVIDFGVAKATEQRLTERTLFTDHGMMIGTPAYMSPEQAELSAIGVDARSDVYSLGVLLYEMIVGVLPFETESLRRAGYAEIQRIIREVEPSKPSTRFRSLGADSGDICGARRIDRQSMHRQLSGDLDWITMKAIDKNPARRYASASELAADIQRHLEDQPVLASPPSRLYQISKFVRRNRGVVVTGVLLFVSLLLGVVGTTLGWIRAREAERQSIADAAEAKRQAEVAIAVNEFLNNDLLSAVSPSSEKGKGRDVRMRDVLDAAAVKIDAASAPGGVFADKPMVEANIRDTLGVTYQRLGEFKLALPHQERARKLVVDARGADDFQSIRIGSNLGNLYQAAGMYQEAEELQVAMAEAAERTLGPEHAQTLVCKNSVATLQHLLGHFDEAARIFREIVSVRRRVLGDSHRDTIATVSNLGIALTRGNKLDDAEALFREWLPIAVRSLPADDPGIGFIQKNLGEVLARKGNFNEAREQMTAALDLRRRIMGEEHPETLTSMHDLAVLSLMERKADEAVELLTTVTKLRTKVLGEGHADTLSAKSNLANAYMTLGKNEQCEEILNECLQVARRDQGETSVITLRVMYLLAWLYMQQNRLEEAEAINTRLYEAQKEKFGAEHDQTLATLEAIGETQLRGKRYAESEATLGQLLSIYRRLVGDGNPTTERIREKLAKAYEDDGKPTEAQRTRENSPPSQATTGPQSDSER